MCLNGLGSIRIEDIENVVYKVVEKIDGKFYPIFRGKSDSKNQRVPFIVNSWANERDYRGQKENEELIIGSYTPFASSVRSFIFYYPRGFHCFLDKDDAFDFANAIFEEKRAIVFEADYNDIVAVGKEHNADVAVVKKIKILKEIYKR